MRWSRWCHGTVSLVLTFGAALVAAPGGASGADSAGLRPVPSALSGADLRMQARDVAAVTGSPRGFPAVFLSPGTIAGYIPLDLFGGTVVSPIGDEEIKNVDVPSFTYNGSSFSTIGIDANGYVLPGGGSGEDNNCCDIGLGTSRPNGILAPFWTDLDGTGAQGILYNVLTDGVGTWIVVEWRVNDFGTTRSRVFQLWLGVGGVQDIAYSYDFSTFGSSPAGAGLHRRGREPRRHAVGVAGSEHDAERRSVRDERRPGAQPGPSCHGRRLHDR